MPTLDLATGPLFYTVDGDADAPPLLLSHSLGCDHHMWEPQLAQFSERFCLIRYDSRGHGASATPAGPYRIDDLGQDVLALMDHLSHERFAFCGLSMGGMVGMWLGVNAGKRLERLVLCNTAAYLGPRSFWDSRITAVLTVGMAAVTEAVVDRCLTEDFQRRHPSETASLRATLLANDPAGYCACCAAIRDMDHRDRLGAIHTPTLVIAGRLDLATPSANAMFIAKSIATSQLVELDSAHLSNVEQADAFRTAVCDFL
jgi:3-oxoadipate enol-lactonase